MNEVPKSGYWTTWFVGLSIIGAAFLARHQLTQMEETGTYTRTHGLVVLAYKSFSIDGTFILLLGIGIFILLVGVKDFFTDKKE